MKVVCVKLKFGCAKMTHSGSDNPLLNITFFLMLVFIMFLENNGKKCKENVYEQLPLASSFLQFNNK